MSKVKISIIVPLFNVEKYLDQCVQSLMNQTLRELEIIFVDDGSNDGCPQMCDDYAKQDNRIKVIHQTNTGLSGARNVGIEVARGEYFMFVDADDWLDLNACEETYKYVTQNDADCLMFTYVKEFGIHNIVNHTFPINYFVWDKKEIQTRLHRRLFGPIDKELSCPQDCDLMVSAWGQLFLTEKFREVKFVDTKIIGTEDCWYQVLIYQNCERFVYIDQPFYHYRKTNPSSLTAIYNPHLFQRWQTMYDYLEEYIRAEQLSQVYSIALQNRIAISILGLGINQIHSEDSLLKDSKRLKEMLRTKRYKKVLCQLNTKIMPFEWYVFFFLCKHRLTLLLVLMLKVIDYFRTHSTKNSI